MLWWSAPTKGMDRNPKIMLFASNVTRIVSPADNWSVKKPNACGTDSAPLARGLSLVLSTCLSKSRSQRSFMVQPALNEKAMTEREMGDIYQQYLPTHYERANRKLQEENRIRICLQWSCKADAPNKLHSNCSTTRFIQRHVLPYAWPHKQKCTCLLICTCQM